MSPTATTPTHRPRTPTKMQTRRHFARVARPLLISGATMLLTAGGLATARLVPAVQVPRSLMTLCSETCAYRPNRVSTPERPPERLRSEFTAELGARISLRTCLSRPRLLACTRARQVQPSANGGSDQAASPSRIVIGLGWRGRTWRNHPLVSSIQARRARVSAGRWW